MESKTVVPDLPEGRLSEVWQEQSRHRPVLGKGNKGATYLSTLPTAASRLGVPEYHSNEKRMEGEQGASGNTGPEREKEARNLQIRRRRGGSEERWCR